MIRNVERCFRPETKVKHKSGVTTTIVETPAYRALREAERIGTKVGKDTAELLKDAKEFSKNYAFQNIATILIVLAAHKNQPAEVPARTEVQPQIEPQPPVEAPAVPEESAINQPFSYTIQRQDTLFGLAQRFGTSVEAILQANPGIKNRDLIHAGQELVIPGRLLPEISPKTINFRPEVRGLTEKEVDFISWLNSSGLKWRDWNGGKQEIFLPYWIYQLAKAAEEASSGRCQWYHLVGIGLTETGYFKGSQWDPEAVSYARARGVMQFMPGTFPIYAPYEGADPEDPIDNMMTACNMIIYLRLPEAKSREEWVMVFLGNGPTDLMWNNHESQAENSKRLADELKKSEAMFNGMYGQTINE